LALVKSMWDNLIGRKCCSKGWVTLLWLDFVKTHRLISIGHILVVPLRMCVKLLWRHDELQILLWLFIRLERRCLLWLGILKKSERTACIFLIVLIVSWQRQSDSNLFIFHLILIFNNCINFIFQIGESLLKVLVVGFIGWRFFLGLFFKIQLSSFG